MLLQGYFTLGGCSGLKIYNIFEYGYKNISRVSPPPAPHHQTPVLPLISPPSTLQCPHQITDNVRFPPPWGMRWGNNTGGETGGKTRGKKHEGQNKGVKQVSGSPPPGQEKVWNRLGQNKNISLWEGLVLITIFLYIWARKLWEGVLAWKVKYTEENNKCFPPPEPCLAPSLESVPTKLQQCKVFEGTRQGVWNRGWNRGQKKGWNRGRNRRQKQGVKQGAKRGQEFFKE